LRCLILHIHEVQNNNPSANHGATFLEKHRGRSASLLLPCGKFGKRRITVAAKTQPNLITYKIIVGKSEEKRPLERNRGECEDKLILKVPFYAVNFTYTYVFTVQN
jgi:hypothetical protein